ncbi:MAG: heme-binding protein [Gammaproteobacteria bacterium]
MSNHVVTNSYGLPVDLELAKKLATGAIAEATRNNWRVVVAIVDTHGLLKYYEMMDDVQTASATVAIEKARTAAMFRRPTKMFEDGIAGGRTALLGMHMATPIEGGLPIVMNGKVIGAIGISGLTSQQDGQVAQAGLDTLK